MKKLKHFISGSVKVPSLAVYFHFINPVNFFFFFQFLRCKSSSQDMKSSSATSKMPKEKQFDFQCIVFSYLFFNLNLQGVFISLS